VQNFINKHKRGELHFDPYVNYEDIINITHDTSLEELIKKVLKCTEKHSSINRKGNFETCARSWRSSLDIYRHCLYYNKNITIFQVMASIYRIRTELIGQFCNDIQRRVFCLRKYHPGCFLLNVSHPDEYGLIFSEWEDIDKIIKQKEFTSKINTLNRRFNNG